MKIRGSETDRPTVSTVQVVRRPIPIAYSPQKIVSAAREQKRDCPRNSRNNPHCGGSNMQLNALAMATSALLAFGSAPLHAQTWQMPPDNQRCPSKWGAADQRVPPT
jgi:hypothetical protein